MKYITTFLLILFFYKFSFCQHSNHLNIDSLYSAAIEKTKQGKYEESIFYLLRALDNPKLKENIQLMNVNKQIGIQFMALEKYVLGQYYLNKGMNAAMGLEKVPRSLESAKIMELLAICSYETSNYDAACNYLSAAALVLGAENLDQSSLLIFSKHCMNK
jgi:tetratricopeptide (TPR) repeat protein